MDPSVGGAAGREAAARPPTAEEETLKRNTDCVYFLASPLTCKKGNECEYRHSEAVRINPRECWYWLNGNCLNPKCSFRHPPLDTLFGVPGTASVPVPSQTAATPQVHSLQVPAYNLNKQGVPCHFFQKGQCLKGDRCAFLHGPQPISTPIPHRVVKILATVTEPPRAVKEPWSLKECTQNNIPKSSSDKPVDTTSSAKTKAESLPRNGFALKRSLSPYPLENELPVSNNVPLSNSISVKMPWSHHSLPVDERLQNGRNADEFLEESCPGLDVLAVDAVEDSSEDDFVRESVQGGRNHPDFEPVTSFDKDLYNEMGEYDRHGPVQNRYSREQKRPSFERTMGRQFISERRLQHRESPEEMETSDLRHRLLKQRKLNGSRSTVSPERHGILRQRNSRSIGEERHRGHHHPHRGQHHFLSERPLSNRLQGRIELPTRSSLERLDDPLSERDRDRARHRGRLSPVRPVDYPGRQERHDKIKPKAHEDFAADSRNFRSQTTRTDDTDNVNFAGPKSLAELRGVKISEISQEQSIKSSINTRLLHGLGTTRSGELLNHREADALSFGGPKPLGDILKRKRQIAPGNGQVSNNNGNNNNNRDGALHSSVSAAVSDLQLDCLPEAIKGDSTVPSVPESKAGASEDSEEEEGLILETDEYVQSSDKATVETEEERSIMDAAENQEPAISERGMEESDYEAVDGGDAEEESHENLSQDEELDDDDDDDDFARKIGVMFS